MIKILEFSKVRPEEILNRSIQTETEVDEIVSGILSDVRENGDAALRKYAEKFDGARLDSLEVTPEEIEAGVRATDPEFIRTLEMAAANIRAFHEKQVHNNFDMTRADGVLMGQRYTPIEKAGVYVPGGTASYLSTVLMDVIPAQIAGVSEIVMMTPPKGWLLSPGPSRGGEDCGCDPYFQKRRCAGYRRPRLWHGEHSSCG